MGLVGLPRAADGSDLGDGADAGQSLPAESKRRYALQVVDLSDLARRMGLEGGVQILGVHAAAVIGDADELAAAVLHGHDDLRSPGVDAVLHQFLDHAGGPLDHLAGRNHVDHVLIEVDYLTHELSVPPQGGPLAGASE